MLIVSVMTLFRDFPIDISEHTLADLQFAYLHEVGICVMPFSRAFLIFSCPLILLSSSRGVLATSVSAFLSEAYRGVAATLHSLVETLAYPVGISCRDMAACLILRSHLWDRLCVDTCMFALVCYGLSRFIREMHGVHPSPLIRLLVRDGEHNVTPIRLTFSLF